jgi:hypothetical protein
MFLKVFKGSLSKNPSTHFPFDLLDNILLSPQIVVMHQSIPLLPKVINTSS